MTEEQHAVARLKQGDLAGLEYLVQRYQVQAVRAAYLIVQDRPLAEDLAQQAFLRAYDCINQFDASRPFGPWFLRVVVNDALKAATHQKRTAPLNDEGQEYEDGLRLAPGAWLADPAPPPEAQVEAAERCRLVRQALRRLPPEQRAALVLRYYLDLSDAELAHRLDQPLTTVKWWLRDGRRRLKGLLSPAHLDEN